MINTNVTFTSYNRS